jgi:hypothetical protein
MKRKWQIAALTTAVVATSVSFVAVGSASDHTDSPMTTSDKQLDIGDVYAFMRPEPTGPSSFGPSTHLVLVMTVNPDATTSSTFNEAAEYTFQIRRQTPELGDDFAYKVICGPKDREDGGGQVMVCNAAGTFGAADVNAEPTGSSTDALRVWAGLRSDPAFVDRSAIAASQTAGTSSFQNPGTNAFQGKNVLAIVVELDVAKIFNPTNAAVSSDMFAVSATSQRVF